MKAKSNEVPVPKLLTESEYKETFGGKMKRVGADAEPPVDIWPYFDKIAAADFAGHDCSAGEVEYVYRDPSDRYEHILVNSRTKDIFMAVVVDLREKRVVGHHLLDLPKLYGTDR